VTTPGGRQSRRVFLAWFAFIPLAGCVSTQIDEVPPSFETLQTLREQQVPPLRVGRFALGEGVPRRMMIRGSDLHPPKGEDFADFLRATFEGELKAAGNLDPAAPLQIDGVLIESHAGENMKTGHASLAARINLTRRGAIVLAKDYRVETQWKSDFIGAIAVPDAFREYNGLYAALVRNVLGDPEFIAAAKR
jgi:hypothetical protein